MYNPMRKDESGEQIRVAIADDHILFRAGVKTALSMQKDIRMVGEADNGMQLLNLLKTHHSRCDFTGYPDADNGWDYHTPGNQETLPRNTRDYAHHA
jgi:hypothetical protein